MHVFHVAVLFVRRLLLFDSVCRVCLFLVSHDLLNHAALQHELVLELSLLSLSQLRKLLYDVLTVFETESADYLTSLAVSLSLRHIIVLFTHVHVPCSISGVFFAAVVQARELLLELLSAPSNMLFTQSFLLTDLRSQLCLNLQILNKTINEFVLGLSYEVRVQSLGERAFELAFIDLLLNL